MIIKNYHVKTRIGLSGLFVKCFTFQKNITDYPEHTISTVRHGGGSISLWDTLNLRFSKQKVSFLSDPC